MADFNKIKQILKDSIDNKLVIVDEDDSFVIITLDEYQKLLERSKLVDKIQGKVSDDTSEQDNKKVNQAESGYYNSEENSNNNQFAKPANSTEREIREVNEQLDNLGGLDEFDSGIRYERLNNGYSEEPL